MNRERAGADERPPHGEDTRRFTRSSLLGRGSLGCVYRAWDSQRGEEVAVKTLESARPDAIYRLKQEFRAVASLRHPNLVRLHELFIDATDCFFTMELVDGDDFVTWVRGPASAEVGEAEYERLRTGLTQLVSGLSMLHASGRLHRDVKPANVKVRPDGTIVLLDFDLALDFGSLGVREPEDSAGTLAYMAPEQIFGGPVGPAIDWYSVGVLAYEALTGRCPFDGPLSQSAVAKARSRPVRPSAWRAGIPEPLDTLIVDLLDPEPGLRPTGDEISRRLSAWSLSPSRQASAGRSAQHHPFVGRTSEMAALQQALDAAQGGKFVLVRVHGPSGIGKTELVKHVLTQAELERGMAVLGGRCHERESVPFKAFDSVVDALTRLLAGLSGAERAACVPRASAALVQLFPVLARVAELAAAASIESPIEEPRERRRLGFVALRELVSRLARTRTMVLWIDDLQWADVDSAILLRELVRVPDPPPVALVFTFRSEDRARLPLLAALDDVLRADGSIAQLDLEIGPLPNAEAANLAMAMCPPSVPIAAQMERVVVESGGSPFLIGELLQYLVGESDGDGGAAPREISLEAVTRERVARLSEAARETLELVAVAGRPLDRRILFDAACGDEGTALRRKTLSSLEERLLLRSTAVEDRLLIETYHDRIRELVYDGLAPYVLSGRHRQLAEALRRSSEPDPEALFEHYLGAGDRPLAAEFAARAGDAAADGLAFHRAAELYERSLELGAGVPGLRLKRAEALANAGRGHAAAVAFEAVVESIAEDPRSRDEIGPLRCRAAEQYLQTGHLTEGMQLIRIVLAEVGIRLPRTGAGKLWWFAKERLRLAALGGDLRAVPGSSVERGRMDRLQACSVVSNTLGLIDPMLASTLGMRAAREAVAAGDRATMVRRLAATAVSEAAFGSAAGRRRSRQYLDAVERLRNPAGDPYENAVVAFANGCIASHEGRWLPALEQCRKAAIEWRERCRGAAFEASAATAYELAALAQLGEMRELGELLPAVLAAEDERGNLVASVGLRLGIPSIWWLAEDRAEEARAMADQWIARWPAAGFSVQHSLHLTTAVQGAIYAGDGADAWKRIAAAWAPLRRAGYLGLPHAMVELRFLRGRAALAVAADAGRGGKGIPSRSVRSIGRWVEIARRDADRIERRIDIASAAPYAMALRAGIARLAGRPDRAIDALERAVQGFDRASMGLYRAAAAIELDELRTGAVRGDDSPEHDGVAWMLSHGVRQPRRLTRVLLPGF